eukprot:m.277690 g.277690  ORF g.277690 m.277690 type:complete len:156 (+) comp15731_c0_seq6:80-547(+)
MFAHSVLALISPAYLCISLQTLWICGMPANRRAQVTKPLTPTGNVIASKFSASLQRFAGGRFTDITAACTCMLEVTSFVQGQICNHASNVTKCHVVPWLPQAGEGVGKAECCQRLQGNYPLRLPAHIQLPVFNRSHNQHQNNPSNRTCNTLPALL